MANAFTSRKGPSLSARVREYTFHKGMEGLSDDAAEHLSDDAIVARGRRKIAAKATEVVVALGLSGLAAHQALHSNTVNAGIDRAEKQATTPQPQAPTYPEGARPAHGDIPHGLQTQTGNPENDPRSGAAVEPGAFLRPEPTAPASSPRVQGS